MHSSTSLASSMRLPLALILLLLASTTSASLFNLFSSPAITQDVVWLYANSSSINEVVTSIPAVMYDEDVQPASNLTQPSSTGLRGILYDRGQTCPQQQQQQQQQANVTVFFDNNYQHLIPRVALVKGGGSCAFADKIKLAQQDGAIGVIAYDDGSGAVFPGDYEDGIMNLPISAGITIPTYHIDADMGIHLQHMVSDFVGKATPQQQQAMRVLMVPGISRGPNPWELTLIIMSILLGLGFMGSVIMHCHLVRKNRILRQQVEAGLIPPPPDMLPMGKQLLDPEQLEKMPTRTVGGERAASDDRAGRRKSSRISNASKIDASSTRSRQQGQGDVDDDDDDDDDCVICLEKIEHGDRVRQLPCEHEYHCDCIDPWLTSKCGECPLCKFDCVAALAPPSEQQQTPADDEDTYASSWTARVKRMLLGRRRRPGDVERQQPRNEDESIELSSTATAAPQRS